MQIDKYAIVRQVQGQAFESLITKDMVIKETVDDHDAEKYSSNHVFKSCGGILHAQCTPKVTDFISFIWLEKLLVGG